MKARTHKFMFYFFLSLSVFINSACYACDSNNDRNEPGDTGEYADFHWEKSRNDILSLTDMVLIYGGSVQRDVKWDKNHFDSYVSYVNRAGQEKWLFDGFLFLEISNGKQGIFATGYYGLPAGKEEWATLADYYFTAGNGVYALDKSVAETAERIGPPSEKRKVVIGIPEPIVAGPGSHYTTLPAGYWGQVGDKKLDFTSNEDRIEACIWFIDYVRKRFNEGQFENVELAGFYWIAEESLHTRTILSGIASYLNNLKYSFNWIPYWKTNPDYYEWRSLKFNYAYLQPNYFFNDKVPYSRLTDACRVAKKYDLDLEMEFDLDVLTAGKNRGSRLYDYMKVFREEGVLKSKRIAYYQDCDALYRIHHSANQQDQDLYHDFCSFVTDHQSLFKSND